MSAGNVNIRVQFAHIAVVLLLCSSAVGAVLIIVRAPLWAFYLAPILGLPVLIPLIRQRAWDEQPNRHQRHPDDPAGILREQLAAAGAARIALTDLAEYLLAPAAVAAVVAVTVLPTGSDPSSAITPVLGVIGVIAAFAVTVVALRSRRMREELVQVVVPVSEGWEVRSEDRESSRYRTKAEATRAARRHLENEGGGKLVVQTRDGEVRDTDTVPPSSPQQAEAGRRA